jgi:hypothetical protein
MNKHIGDSAELYALGVLDASERHEIEAHVALWDTCARELGRAEAIVVSLDSAAVVRHEAPKRLLQRIIASADNTPPLLSKELRLRGKLLLPRVTAWSALAAAMLLFVSGVWLVRENTALRTSIARNDLAFVTVARSHFRHTNFSGNSADAPTAKVLYALDGSWLYLIIDQADCACRLNAHTASGERDLGSPINEGTTSTLFVTTAEKPLSLDLIRDSDKRILSTATLVYESLRNGP